MLHILFKFNRSTRAMYLENNKKKIWKVLNGMLITDLINRLKLIDCSNIGEKCMLAKNLHVGEYV